MSKIFVGGIRSACSGSQNDNCFFVINDISDEMFSKIVFPVEDPLLYREQLSILNYRRTFFLEQTQNASDQYFEDKQLYINVIDSISIVAGNNVTEIAPYIDNTWQPYQDVWTRQPCKIVSHANTHLLLLRSSDVTESLVDNYDIDVKQFQNDTVVETLTSNAVIVVFPDPVINPRSTRYSVNGAPESGIYQNNPSETTLNLTISSPYRCFMFRLTPKI